MYKHFNLKKDKGSAWVIFSVFMALVIITATLVFTTKPERVPPNINVRPELEAGVTPDPSLVPPVTQDDHVFGDINAPIQIIEYSDIECVFCQRLHVTLKQLTEQFPDEIVWVYRHMPILQNNGLSIGQVIATECAAEQQGNDGFWTMLNRIHEETSGGRRFSLSMLPALAEEQGLNVDEFNECRNSGRFDERIQQQISDGFMSGATGTPYSIIISPMGNHIPVAGAQPLDFWVNIIEELIEFEIEKGISVFDMFLDQEEF